MAESGMVIIGAGEAGARAAVELRARGWPGTITIVGEEKWGPYERPPLSKRQLLADDEQTPVHILREEMLVEHNIRLLTGRPAVHIDRSGHFVEVADGSRLRYERLLLATGARPRKLPIAGPVGEKLIYLRTFDDALNLRPRLAAGRRIAVIGGGFIGLEVAATAVERGCEVTLIEIGPRILMRAVPSEIAALMEARHRAAGVTFKLGAGLERIAETADGFELLLADQTVVRCDEVVIGIGAVPETTLAAECGLEIENGVKADERLATSDPAIFAAGDCCSFPHVRYGGRRIRLEAWRNAQDQGIHAAGNMLGANEPYRAIPWFWSDQYDLTLQVAGLPEFGVSTAVRELGGSAKLMFHLEEDGTLAAVSGIGPSSAIAKAVRIGEKLVERRASIDAVRLADPGVKLKSLL